MRVPTRWLWVASIVGCLLAARLLPESLFSLLRCPWQALVNMPCLTCGGTRSLRALVQLDLGTAFLMNALVALCALLGLADVPYAVLWAPTRASQATFSTRTRVMLTAGVLIMGLSNWAYLIAVGR